MQETKQNKKKGENPITGLVNLVSPLFKVYIITANK